MNAIQRRIAIAIMQIRLPRGRIIGLRNASIFAAIECGESSEYVAALWGISRMRVSQIIETVSRIVWRGNSVMILQRALADIEPVTEPETYVDDRADGLPKRGPYENDDISRDRLGRHLYRRERRRN